mmetsp:Transcript_15888/g.24467  ORF Transcript_15888/g.24467 Transcript_15888/m.24467 type:complete len:202 (-) Transcript_15888:294-899(-)
MAASVVAEGEALVVVRSLKVLLAEDELEVVEVAPLSNGGPVRDQVLVVGGNVLADMFEHEVEESYVFHLFWALVDNGLQLLPVALLLALLVFRLELFHVEIFRLDLIFLSLDFSQELLVALLEELSLLFVVARLPLGSLLVGSLLLLTSTGDDLEHEVVSEVWDSKLVLVQVPARAAHVGEIFSEEDDDEQGQEDAGEVPL